MWRWIASLLLGVLMIWALPVHAQTAPEPLGLWERDSLTGDGFGLGERLAAVGVTLTLQEQSELWNNPIGGRRAGSVYTGLTTASIKLDLEKVAGWTGTTFYMSLLQIHGRGPSLNLTGNLQTVSNIEATRSNKLYNLWLEQTALEGRLNIRIGQEGANDEMMLPKLGAMFINSSFGYPALLAFDLPSGGPNYPIAAPMVRAKYQLTDRLTVVGAVFNGDPAGPGSNDPQYRDYTGTAFRLRDGTLSFLEFWYNISSDEADGRPGTYKLGTWHHSGRFSDPAHDTRGRSLADPLSNDTARRYHGNQAVYAVMDQILWRPAGEKERGLGVFALAMAAPDDRNFTSLFIEGGLNWTGPLAERPNDVLGLAFSFANLGSAQRAFGADMLRFGATAAPLRKHETVIELTYQYQVAPWLILQPDAQYIINPGATTALKDAVVTGVRATVTF